MTTELLRSSFDVDGVRLDLLWNEKRYRFTIATRWINLAHFGCSLPTDANKALALTQASAAFEAVCMDGATRSAAQNAKKAARSIHPARCISPAGYEREVLRRSAKPTTA